MPEIENNHFYNYVLKVSRKYDKLSVANCLCAHLFLILAHSAYCVKNNIYIPASGLQGGLDAYERSTGLRPDAATRDQTR